MIGFADAQALGIDISEPTRLYPGYWQRSLGTHM